MRFMPQDSSRVVPAWLISTLGGAVMVSAIAAYLVLRHPSPPPSPPPAIVVSACRDLAPGMRRVGFDTHFDVPETGFNLRIGRNDMPPQVFYCVRVKNGTADTMEMSSGPLLFEAVWSSAYPVFSDRVDPALASGPLGSPNGYQERDVRNVHGRVVGQDRWGHFKKGERWRLVKFVSGERVGYPPTPDNEAQLFDQIISSACFPPAPHP
jgi:hypothetical protein